MANKYFQFNTYLQFLKRKYVELRYPTVAYGEVLETEQRAIFKDLGLDYDFGINLLNELLPKLGIDRYDEKNGMMSQHWVIFAAISKKFQPSGILEIGTFNGRSTNVLSNIFPKSHIETIELPDDSPHFIGTYNRNNTSVRAHQIAERTENLKKSPNVTLNQINSFNIGRLFGDRKFGLIWIDGDHSYPAVAWDIFYGLNALRKGGWLMADDFYLHPKSHLLATYNESYEATRYLSIDNSINPSFIHKRVYCKENIVKHKHILIIKG